MEVVAMPENVNVKRKEELAVTPTTNYPKGEEEQVVVATQNPEPARRRRNRIQVSMKKKPLYFYVNLAKRIMQQQNEVVLSALGMAIGTVVIIAEILKNNGLATEKQILTSTVDAKDEAKGRLIHKAKIEILLGKSANFNSLMSAGKAEKPINNMSNAGKAEKPINNMSKKVNPPSRMEKEQAGEDGEKQKP